MLSAFHPLVARWFAARFGDPTEPQARGWPAIQAGRDVLIAAPTGSGKTLAAFLWCVDDLFRRAAAGTLDDRTSVVYVSPLKALGNDVEKNLLSPLAELREAARAEGLELPEIRTAVRTGDTPARDRAAMLKRPPHILITTPESLYLLLTSEGGRKLLQPARTVIVDEIHAVARDKRGSHLALSLERLDALHSQWIAAGGLRATVSPPGSGGEVPRFNFALCTSRLQRIGLSATQKPIELIGRFLVGAAPAPEIVDAGHARAMDLSVVFPRDELSSVASKELWAETYADVAAQVLAHRSTLVFVNTRRHVERASHALAQLLGEDHVAAHHGSLAREKRLDAEQKLKAGVVKCVVATASLELGIDVGAVELVVQLGSPRAIAVGLQRIGRSGHWKGATPKGRLYPATRDELVECAAFVRGVRRGALEKTRIPEAPLDVLAQQIVAAAACEETSEDALYALVRRAYPYAGLTRAAFDSVVAMHTDGVASREGRKRTLLHRDLVNGTVKGRRGARLAALTSGGAIPDTAQYAVVAEPEGVTIGSLDEDFAIESMAGDIFLLGNTSWRIRRVETGTVRVEDAHGQPPSIPFWLGEAPGRSPELSAEVSSLRKDVEPLLPTPDAAARWLAAETGLSAEGARFVVAYLAAGREALGALPTQDTLIAERFFDESGGMQIVIHAPFGQRTNRAFGMALRKRFCRSFDFELQAAATDDGILLSLGSQHSFPLETIFGLVTSLHGERPEAAGDGSPELARATEGASQGAGAGPLRGRAAGDGSPALVEVLTQAALQAPMFGVRWRWNATCSLAVLRRSGGKKTPPYLLRMRSEDLLAGVFPQQLACQDNAPGGAIIPPDHPLVAQTLRDCLTDAMDLPGLDRLLARIAAGHVRLLSRDVAEPSVLSHEVVHSQPYTFLDDAPLEERRVRAVTTRRSLPLPEAQRELGALDAEAIDTVVEQAWPDVRDAAELHDALLGLGALPEAGAPEAWRPLFAELVAARRATRLGHAWTTAERLVAAQAAFPLARAEPPLTVPPSCAAAVAAEDAVHALVRGWMAVLGPATAAGVARRTGLDAGHVAVALARLELEGNVLRGRFRSSVAPNAPESQGAEFCERSLLARIHRLTLGRLRREIEPVSTADFVRFLLRWQHAHPGSQLHGVRGVREVIAQLQGVPVAAAAWERDVLPARVSRYEPAWLDELCASGEVAWGRFVPPAPDAPSAPAKAGPAAVRERAARAPTRAAPVCLVLREDLPWLLTEPRPPGEPLGDAASDVRAALVARGASFASELAAATSRSLAELEPALWELVAAGEVTSDGFAGLRGLVDARRHDGRGAGRWSLLRPPASAARDVERLASQYLRRWGVVLRDLVAREPLAPPWRELAVVYRRREARGELRGGRFVAGVTGEQFALPEAVETLRAVRRASINRDAALAEPSAFTRRGAAPGRSFEGREWVELSAADPLNLTGGLLAGPRVPALAGNRLLYVDGVPRLAEPEQTDAAPPSTEVR